MSAKTFCRLSAAVLVLGIWVGSAHGAAPQSGWWWNPNESGRGYYIERQADVLFMAAYFYESDGRPTWMISGGKISAPYDSYSGRLTVVKGGQTLLGDYRKPTGADAGAITLAFSDDAHGTLVWPGGTVAIERQTWSAARSDLDPNGWWWNPDESGRGFSIEVRGNTLVMAGFMYDDAGDPTWYLSSGPLTTPMHYEGTLLRIPTKVTDVSG